MKKAIFLFDYLGEMAQDWLAAGYECWLFDGKHKPGIHRDGNLVKVGMWFSGVRGDDWMDAREIASMVGDGVEIIIGFPECTYLTTTGARWLYHPDDGHLPTGSRRPHPLHPDRVRLRAEAVVLAGLTERVADVYKITHKRVVPWAFENPKGNMLCKLHRPYDHWFNPCDYGGYLPEDHQHRFFPEIYPGRDAYNKATAIWCGNGFVMPEKRPVDPVDKQFPGFVKLGGKSARTKEIRSATPEGFAKAVFMHNANEVKSENL